MERLSHGQDTRQRAGQLFWAKYFNMEKEVYKQLLANPDKIWEGTVKDLQKNWAWNLNIL